MDVRRHLVLLALALCGLLGRERPAAAFVQSVTTGPPQNPLAWSTSCETATIYLNGFTGMTPDEVAKSISAAAAVWDPDQVTCPAANGDGGSGHPYFQILTQLSTGGVSPGVANDGKNTITFVTANWGEAAEALAFTSVWKEPDGQIVDADIEINATDPTGIPWANLDPGAPPERNGIARFDLQTVMTHEFGHFLGLAHTCLVDMYGGVDHSNDGNEPPSGVPGCSVAGPDAVAAVMYPIIDPESIAKRVLTADDARGVCAIYPAAQDPHSCTQNTPDDGCGCAAGGRAGLGAGLATVVAALALVLPGRRRRR